MMLTLNLISKVKVKVDGLILSERAQRASELKRTESRYFDIAALSVANEFSISTTILQGDFDFGYRNFEVVFFPLFVFEIPIQVS